MAKGHRSQIKRERNANKDTRPSAKLSYARVSVQKACFVLDAIRGKDLETAIGIVTYNPRYASTLIKKLLDQAPQERRGQCREQQWYGPLQTVCGGVLRQQRTDHEESKTKGTGQSLQNREKNEPHHRCAE